MRVRCAALIVENGKALFLKYNYPKGEVYAIPGGGIERGESMPATLAREFEEELGLTITLGPLLFVADVMDVGSVKQAVHLVFQAEILKGIPHLRKEHTTADEVVWLEPEALRLHRLYPNIGDALFHFLTQSGSVPTYLGDRTPKDWY